MFDTIKELIEEQKYVQLKKEIIKLDEADIAELLEGLNNENLIMEKEKYLELVKTFKKLEKKMLKLPLKR